MQNAISTPLGPNQRVTPQDLQARAQAIAQEMMQKPDGQRQGEMMKLKERDWTTWMAVSAVMEDIQQHAKQTGGQQFLAQQFGGQGGQPQGQ